MKTRAARPAAGALLVILVFCTGCTDEDPNALVKSPPPFARGYKILASQPFLPSDLNQKAVLVTRDKDMEDVWRHFQLGGDVPQLHENEEVALFLGTGESGSCPIKIEDVKVDSDGVEVRTASYDGACTADFSPRTFVLLFRPEVTPIVGTEVTIDGARIEIEEVPPRP